MARWSCTIRLCPCQLRSRSWRDTRLQSSVFLFFSFQHQNKTYSCALIQWYSYVGTHPDEDTGLWKIEPDTKDDGSPHLAVIHLDLIFRAVHLMPAYCTAEFISRTITMHSSLDTFNIFYVNRYADHHLFANLSWTRHCLPQHAVCYYLMPAYCTAEFISRTMHIHGGFAACCVVVT